MFPRILNFGTRCEWSASQSGLFIPGERAPITYLTGGWVDPRDALDLVEKKRSLLLPRIAPRSSSSYSSRFTDSYHGS